MNAMSDKFIYRLDDEISFRKCSLFDECNTDHGDCTNFRIKEFHFCDNYFCNQEGIHFHCTKHPEIELGQYRTEKSAKYRRV